MYIYIGIYIYTYIYKLLGASVSTLFMLLITYI